MTRTEAIHMGIEPELKAVLDGIAEDSNKNLSSVIIELIQGGLEVKKSNEALKRVETTNSELIRENSALEGVIQQIIQRLNKLESSHTDLSSSLRETQDVVIERMNGYNNGLNKLSDNEKSHRNCLQLIAEELGCKFVHDPYHGATLTKAQKPKVKPKSTVEERERARIHGEKID